jgi:ABC-type dipeptide/oligopeptide/nickel transport system permease component
MAMAIFAVALNWFPTGGVRTTGMEGDIVEALANIFTFGRSYPELAGKQIPTILDGLRHLALPVLVLAFFKVAVWSRYTRASMLEVMRQDYIRTARAKGLQERVVVLRHMLRNALIPVITILGPALATLVTGSFIIEQMLGFPGSGRAFVLSIQQRDYSMIMGTVLLYAVLIAVANLSVDLVYGFLDPRIKVGD